MLFEEALMQAEENHLIRLGPSQRGTILSATSAASSLSPPSTDHVYTANDTPSTLQTGPSPTAPSQWTPDSLVESGGNFSHVPRISATLSPAVLLAKVREHEKTGAPLIIEDWHQCSDWNKELFSMEGFVGDKTQIVDVRDIRTSIDIKMPLGELAHHYEALMEPVQHKVLEVPSYYGKDIPCPESWEGWLRSNLPSHFHPCGENDMISCLPPKDRTETLMCYMGIGDTYTPAHKDSCGSFGHNLMCHTTGGGSALWFMSATGPLHKDEPAAYFHDKLGVELDLENHKATVEEFRAAPFIVYVAEQRLGDLVLVPPRSCHQVVNKGGITIKMSWSRMGVESFHYSLHAELALYHRVCRPETYRVKLNVFSAVKEYTRRLIGNPSLNPLDGIDPSLPLSSCHASSSAQPKDIALLPEISSEVLTNLIRLLSFMNEILIEEWSPDHQKLKHLPVDSAHELHSCDFCGADIFQSFFACFKCSDSDYGSEFICCSGCYVEGRSCICGPASMEPYQSWRFDDLTLELNAAVDVINKYQVSGDRIPQINSKAIESSSHLKTFYAACILRDRVLRQTSNSATSAQCTLCSEPSPSRHTGPSFFLQCRVCDSSMCFVHLLQIRNMHVAEALLASVRDADHAAWHIMHTSNPGKRVVSLDEGHSREQGKTQTLAERMVWAAATFKACRPLDLKLRAKKGFYDKLEPGEVRALPQSVQVSSFMPVTRKRAPIISGFESPLTELSDVAEAEIDYPKDESDDEFLPVCPRKASPQKRRSELAVAQVPTPPSIRSSRSIPYVYISSKLKKRPLVVDSSVPSNPKKRVKMDKYGPPRRKVPKPLEDRTVECTPAAKTVVPKPAPGSRTIVPVGSSLAAEGISGPVPGSSLTSAQDSGKKSLHAAKRVAGHSRLELSKNMPSVYSSVPASSKVTTRAEGASTDHPSPDATAVLVDGLRSELKKERDAKAKLKVQLDEAQRSNAVLRLRMEGLKAGKSDRQAAEMRAEISNLRKELAKEREERAKEREEKAQLEQNHQLNLNHLFHDIMTLKEELKRSQASQASFGDGDRNFSEVSHTTGMVTGSALSQAPPPPSKDLQPPRGPRASSYGTGYTATGSMPNSTYHQTPRRSKPFLTRSGRGRGSGRGFSDAPPGNQHREGAYAFQAAQHRGRRYDGSHHNHSSHRNTRSFHRSNDYTHSSDPNSRDHQQKAMSPKKIIYERHEGSSYGRQCDPKWRRAEGYSPEGDRGQRWHERYPSRTEDVSPHRDRYRTNNKRGDVQNYQDEDCVTERRHRSQDFQEVPNRAEVAGYDNEIQRSSLDASPRSTEYRRTCSQPYEQHDTRINDNHEPRHSEENPDIEVGSHLESDVLKEKLVEKQYTDGESIELELEGFSA